MPAATREVYRADLMPPRIRTSYAPTFSPVTTVKSPMMLSPATRELPMPTVSRITSLGQAQATLLHCWTKLSVVGPSTTPSRYSPPSSPIDGATQRRYYQRWLEQWEQAFTAYLSSAMSGMKNDEITRCRVLKANHLACTILASEAGPDARSFDAFEGEFQAIVELATAVIRSRPRDVSSRSSSPADLNSVSLDVREPLRVVYKRCDRNSIRTAAAELLAQLPGVY